MNLTIAIFSQLILLPCHFGQEHPIYAAILCFNIIPLLHTLEVIHLHLHSSLRLMEWKSMESACQVIACAGYLLSWSCNSFWVCYFCFFCNQKEGFVNKKLISMFSTRYWSKHGLYSSFSYPTLHVSNCCHIVACYIGLSHQDWPMTNTVPLL